MDVRSDAGAAGVRAGIDPTPRATRSLDIEGVVQGVGFRPFVYRLAIELGLDGAVRNVAGRVEVDLSGPPDALDDFARATDPAKQKAIAEAVQVRATQMTSHINLGQWYQPGAHRKNISGWLPSPAPVFWNIKIN